MNQLRIFSYLPNPRIWKATIAARLCGVDVEIRGAGSRELSGWLWDFDAHPLSDKDRQNAASLRRAGRIGFKGGHLFKTENFLAAQPFGTVPAAFGPDGQIGIFESNSIMRAVARLGHDHFPLDGSDPYEASRIDSFLDVSLVFGRDAQIYLFALLNGNLSAELHARMAEAFATYLSGMDQALRPDRNFFVGDGITLADICFVAELCLFSNERVRTDEITAKGLAPFLNANAEAEYPLAFAHFNRLAAHPAFAPDVGPYMKKLAAKSAA
jgi:glutathione S-transferase